MVFEENKPKTIRRVPVRALVEYSLKAGDLVADQFISSSRMAAGIRGHQKIQKSRPDGYLAEVSVKKIIESDRFNLELSGRIDGIYTRAIPPIIDEIKTTTQDLAQIETHPNPRHWAQAKIYGFIYASDHKLAEIDIQLTYYQLDTKKTVEIRQRFTRDELAAFLHELLIPYIAWAEKIADWQITRDASMARLEFPFAHYRPGQRDLAVEVFRTIRDDGQMIVQAPTGIGKTAAVLFPAAKALGAGHVTKLFYLTARTTGRSVAESTLQTMTDKGLRLKSVTLTAREKSCFKPGAACNAEECEFARGYYDRVDNAVQEAFTIDRLTREQIEAVARQHTVCPFEFSLDMTLWVDLVVADYNYAFDPRVYLRRLFFDEIINNPDFRYAFLVDEAHNLVDRAREMFSAELTKQPVLELKKLLGKKLKSLRQTMIELNQWFIEACQGCGNRDNCFAAPELPDGLATILRDFLKEAEKWLVQNQRTDFSQALLELYFDVFRFLRIAEQYDENYATCYEHNFNNVRVKLFCLNPAPFLAECYRRCRSAIFFSATMTPLPYFRDILGCKSDTKFMCLPSPFPPENLNVLLADKISTRYRHREQTRVELGAMLRELIRHHQGNYLFFFPSYRYLQMILEEFQSVPISARVIVQSTGMSEAERVFFLDNFAYDNAATVVGFAVMGGIFGEGIDLAGDRLTGAVIVGVGLPGISPERDLIRDFFARQGRGFEFSYLYPGINRVLQAAGRVIRSETDRGIVYLIDDRFGQMQYRSLLPREWQIQRIGSAEELGNLIRAFWGLE